MTYIPPKSNVFSTIAGRLKQCLGIGENAPKINCAFTSTGGPIRPELNASAIISGNLSADPMRDIVRGDLMSILGHIRNGDRPTLVGRFPGLNPAMETAFRAGRSSGSRSI
ncbi:MAG TPA: hypothetical protein VMD02_00210 [Candidatus Omnitrophota bacterium]|nr:hypothetical protein [Candidatus Omnitrophota bacterium]